MIVSTINLTKCSFLRHNLNVCKISYFIRYLVLKLSSHFPCLSCSFSLYLGLSLSIFINLCLSWSSSIHPGPSWYILEYLCLFQSIFGYLGISLAISGYLYCYLWLFWAISGNLELFWLSLIISIKYQGSGCKWKQERAIYCYLKLFYFIFISYRSEF